ncbi:MAG: hypothetical protein PHW86_06440, partial [Candidatus Bipolaricaulis sp.]|nr:hypothetical protein [Candidatus Bipolaricaulis sp.]
VRAAAAGLTWNGLVRFLLGKCDATTGPRPMTFDAAQLRLDTLLFSCGIPVQAKLVVSDDGFESFQVFVRGIPLDLLSASALETTLDLHLKLGVTEKQIEPMLRSLVGSICAGVQPYIELVDDGFPRIDGIDVYGIEFSCAIGEAAEVRSATCFDLDDATHNRTVTGETEYFERLSLSSLLPGCCGVPGEWGLDVYFERGAPSLFDWGRIDAGVFLPLSSRWFGSLEAEFERSGAWLVSVGFSASF